MTHPITQLQTQISIALQSGDMQTALMLVEKLDINHADAAFIRILLNEARTWHAKGFAHDQQRLCELIITQNPIHFEALHLLGFHAQNDGHYKEAQQYYVRALAVKPDFAFSRLALAQLRMMQSEFQEGSELYEARFEALTENNGPDWRGLPITRWRGESLTDKKLYIWAEQGLGDIIMFAGFLPYLLAQKPARVALGMFPRLIPLFKRSFPSIDVEPIDDAVLHALAPTVAIAFPQIEKLAAIATVPFSLEPLRASYDYVQRHGLFDWAAPMGDLLVYGAKHYRPADHAPYLIADAARSLALTKEMNAMQSGRCVGISWMTSNSREPSRNIPLEAWLPLLRTPHTHFISLQHHVPAEEVRQFCKTHDCNITISSVDITEDAEGLAALMAAMDEVITIDNSNAHMAGALGIKTRLLLPRGSNYRWPELQDGGTLWYKSVQVLRQQVMGGWKAVMEQVVHSFTV